MKKLSILTVVIVCFLLQGGSDLNAKKVKFHYNKGKPGKIKVIKSFVSRYGSVKKAQPLPKRDCCLGAKIFFYYKIGPVQCIKGKGAPYKTRMVVTLLTPGGKKTKDLGWHDGNSANKGQMNSNMWLASYSSAMWNIKLSPNYRPGSTYKVEIYHRDMNSGKTLIIPYEVVTRACQ